ncbi:putative protein serine/threonine kinase [Tieghemostelium lacteum]|uniref:non-specific serine/threonine protein kinase n=1 Tax=Tieghemostelium lacteum TaxID=361077 RepID=A0A151Z5S0_TIELA|nr:putative protein serine/threonine kinase [Tieghemostelium lacteum]|eukprot:KYQ89301.1 putative protein serine/threonine kinase [Tieghemostelium lacteum]
MDSDSQATPCIATQPQADTQPQVPVKTEEQKPVTWGRLVSCHPDSKHLDLIDNEILIGRNPKRCNVLFNDPTISGIHCKIQRERNNNNNNSLSNSTEGTSIRITDYSTNGTFVKGQILGKEKTTLLLNGDLISFTSSNFNSSLSFIFQDFSIPDQDSSDDIEINKHYIIQGMLGTGNFSVVKKCIKKDTGESFAVKIIDKMKYWHLSKNKNQTNSEIAILKKIKHPNIISIIEIFDTERYLYIVLELATGGELFDKIKEKIRFSEPEAKDVFKQILAAVCYLHQLNISHRDLKPENILIGKGPEGKQIIKITDFGLAKIIGEKEIATTLCGTPLYVAPEIIKSCLMGKNTQNGEPHGYGKEVDAWSLGCILYILLSGKPPFDVERSNFNQTSKGEYTFNIPIWDTVTEAAKDLIQKLLKVDPLQRISVKDALVHRWFSNDDLYRCNTTIASPSPQEKKQTTYSHHVIQLPISTKSPNKSFTLGPSKPNLQQSQPQNTQKNQKGILQFEPSPQKPKITPSKKKRTSTSKQSAILTFQNNTSTTTTTTTSTSQQISNQNNNNNNNNNNNLFSKFNSVSKTTTTTPIQEVDIQKSSPELTKGDVDDEIDDEIDDQGDSRKRKKLQTPVNTNGASTTKTTQKKLKSSKPVY